MQSYLLVGGTFQERLDRAQQMADRQWSVSAFDKILIKATKSIGINQIRHLKHRLALKPYLSQYQLTIIPEAEKLTIPAQNAILKLLEEPPANTIIILSCPTAETLLPTIASRCRLISLKPKPQIVINGENLHSQSKILHSILESGVGERFKLASEIAKTRDEAISFCQTQLILWREKMMKEKDAQKKARAAQTLRLIKKTLAMLQANVNPKLAIEHLLLLFPTFPIRDRNKLTNR